MNSCRVMYGWSQVARIIFFNQRSSCFFMIYLMVLLLQMATERDLENKTVELYPTFISFCYTYSGHAACGYAHT